MICLQKSLQNTYVQHNDITVLWMAESSLKKACSDHWLFGSHVKVCWVGMWHVTGKTANGHCMLFSWRTSPIHKTAVTLFTDKNRQEPTRTDKRHFYAFYRLKYYLLDHMYALCIQISHMIAFEAPKTMNLQYSKLPYLPTRSFVRLSWRYTLAVKGTLVLYKKLHRSESISSFAIT